MTKFRVAFLLVCATFSFDAFAGEWSPVQGDFSFGRTFGPPAQDAAGEADDPYAIGNSINLSMYLGSAFAVGPRGPGGGGGSFDGSRIQRQDAFVGAGIEGTVDSGPYAGSIGPSIRYGRLFRYRNSPLKRLPDTYLYSRFTPFVASGGETTGTGGGVRLGIGVSSPAWTRALLSVNVLEASPISGDPRQLLALPFVCAGLVAVAVVNHGELTYELYGGRDVGLQHRVGWRIGTSF